MKQIYECRFWDEEPVVGKTYILVEHYNELTDHSNWEARPDNGEGVGGNLDGSIKRYHGWRGTYNGNATYAHGLRKLVEVIRPIDTSFNYKVKFEPVDYAADKE